MPGVTRKGTDSHVGHASPTPNPFHKTAYAAGSGNVIVNDASAVRVGDATSCGDPAVAGSAKVVVNGKNVHRKGDATGGHASWVANSSAGGSSNVIAGDGKALSFGENEVYNSPAVTYPTRILPALSADEVPPEHPRNSEQQDPATESEPTPQCGEIPQRNPYDVAAEALSLGDAAWKETGSNPNITALWDEIGYQGSAYADETAWCAVFVGAVLKRSGNEFIQTASSQAYRGYGKEVQIEDMQKGDIIVFYRKGRNSGYGHVGFATGGYTSSTIEVLGGNQSNSLNVKTFQRRNDAKGWGIRTIRRAISCEDGDTAPPEATGATLSSVGAGDQVT